MQKQCCPVFSGFLILFGVLLIAFQSLVPAIHFDASPSLVAGPVAIYPFSDWGGPSFGAGHGVAAPAPSDSPTPAPSPSPIPTPTSAPSPTPMAAPTPTPTLASSPSPSLSQTPGAPTPVVIWVARYNGLANQGGMARSMALDGSGNVYVTGSSTGSTGSDYVTIKYNNSGIQQWVARYNGSGNGDDYARSIAVDASGNVYVTGVSSGGAHLDYATVKYNSSGVEQWVARYDGPGNGEDYARSIAVDASGNVYVTGVSSGDGTGYDYATVKYTSTGVEEWVTRYNGSANQGDLAQNIAVDGSGNVYVTGESWGSSTGQDYATVKYNSGGVPQWVTRYNGPRNGNDSAWGVAVDGAGNVYVTGLSRSDTVWYDYATVKYNASGIEQWVARYQGPIAHNPWDDTPGGMAVDGAGNVYVTGFSYSSSTNFDYATIKYTSSGVEEWAARYNGPGSLDDRASDIAVDALGNVYVTGKSYDSVATYDYATVKYNPIGEQQWVARYNGPGNGYDFGKSIAVDGSGNIYVTGLSSSNDCVTIKYGPPASATATPDPTPAPTATPPPGYLLGDINHDGAVDITDLALLAASFNKRIGDTGFNSNADFNSDGIVDILDLVRVGLNFGRTAPAPTPAGTPTPAPMPTPSPSPYPTPVTDATVLYTANNCGLCHGANRQGGLGPPLTATALAGKTTAQVANTIASGSGMMPGFSSALTAAQIYALADWLKTAP